jgi:protein-tyrosine phosphatase
MERAIAYTSGKTTMMINRYFGTWRGLVRLLIGYAELLSGRLNTLRVENPKNVRRLVFVCKGNICRSAFAEKVAWGLGLSAASVGLSTTTGAESPASAVASARRQGVDLSGHRAVNWSDFVILPGDLFLVMEIRQVHELRRRLESRRECDVAVSLLGLWHSPVMPHLHDPFSLSAAYFDTCFARVRQTVIGLSLTTAGAANQNHCDTVFDKRLD